MSKPIAVIERHTGIFHFDWRGFFEYRDLLFLMVRKEIVSKYQQTFLGPLWYILQPILTTGVLFFVFTKALGVDTQGVPPILFYFSGLLIWNYVSQTLNATSMALVSNASLFKRVYFPRVMVPLSQALSFIVTFLVQFGVFLCLYLFYGLEMTSRVLLLPFVLLQITCLAFGLGLWVSALTVRYRDFHHLLSFGLGLWMYASPIAYPIERVPPEWWLAVSLNPLVPAIQIFRQAFLGQGMVSLSHILFSVGTTLAILISGLIYFQYVERNLIDRI